MTDEQALLNDIFDYLMENNHDIGTNFKDEFPNSYITRAGDEIVLLNERDEEIGSIKLKLRGGLK